MPLLYCCVVFLISNIHYILYVHLKVNLILLYVNTYSIFSSLALSLLLSLI